VLDQAGEDGAGSETSDSADQTRTASGRTGARAPQALGRGFESRCPEEFGPPQADEFASRPSAKGRRKSGWHRALGCVSNACLIRAFSHMCGQVETEVTC